MCSSGLLTRKKDGLVTEDFTVGWRKYANIGKIIFNTEYEYVSEDKHNSFMHIIWGKYNEKYFPPVNIFKKNVIWNIHRVRTNDFPIQINHYVTKSYQEYIDRKSKRGGGVHANMHDNKYFFYHESKAGVADYHIYKYLIRLKINLQRNK